MTTAPAVSVPRRSPRRRRLRRADLLTAALDVALLVVSLAGSLLLRYDGRPPFAAWHDLVPFTAVAVGVLLVVFAGFGLYRYLWRHASGAEAVRIVRAETVTWVLLGALLLVVRWVPLSVAIVSSALHTLGAGGIRYYARLAHHRPAEPRDRSRILLVGAGDAGGRLLQAIGSDPASRLLPVAFVDDNPGKVGRRLGSVPVLGTVADLPGVAAQVGADEVVLAVPTASRTLVSRVSALAEEAGLPIRLLPPIHELVHGRVTMADVREVRIDDLLGRQQVQTDLAAVHRLISGKRVLITGAGGSIGSEIARQVAGFDPALLLLLDHDETHLYDVCTSLRYPAVQVLADIRQRAIVNQLFARYRPEVVFHAAAHKHVPLLEEHPCEAVKTNVSGTDSLVAAAAAFGVQRFVFVSTDKAVRPSSVMGATKRLGEHIVLSPPTQTGVFCAVRFGNVLGSRGSVVPTFLRQIKAGGPVTVTDPRMTRFFMSIPEAVQLVLQAAAFATGGEIFMLDMGEPVNIRELAARLIRLQGRRVGTDVEIRVVGMRPGEKLEEELHAPEEDPRRTPHPAIVQLRPVRLSRTTLRKAVTSLGFLAENAADDKVRHLLFDLAYGRLQGHAEVLNLGHQRRSEDRGLGQHPAPVGSPRRRLSDFTGLGQPRRPAEPPAEIQLADGSDWGVAAR